MKIPRFSPIAVIPTMSRPALFDAAIRLLSLALVLVAIFLASRWLTELTAPRPVAKLPSTPPAAQESNLKVVGKLFGVGEVRSESLDGLQLSGLFADSGGGGFATFRTRSGAVSVFTGGEIAPGVRLKQIERDRVIVLSTGIQKELLLNDGGRHAALPIGQSPVLPLQQVPAGNLPQTASSDQESGAGRSTANTQDEEQ